MMENAAYALKKSTTIGGIAPDGIFDWRDITESTAGLKKSGIQLSEGLKLLHVKGNNGKIHVGVDAFIVMQHGDILAVFVSSPFIKQIINLAYRAFAGWRFKRLPHCQLAASKEKP